jgi:hypothetical protein
MFEKGMFAVFILLLSLSGILSCSPRSDSNDKIKELNKYDEAWKTVDKKQLESLGCTFDEKEPTEILVDCSKADKLDEVIDELNFYHNNLRVVSDETQLSFKDTLAVAMLMVKISSISTSFKFKLLDLGSVENILKAAEVTLNELGLKCPEKIWPNFNWNNKGALVILSETKEAWFWSSESRKFNKVDYSSITEDFLYSSYNDGQYKGFRTASVVVEGKTNLKTALNTLFHEAFHFWGQSDESDWVALNAGAFDISQFIRGTIYPLQQEARIQRAMIYYRIYKYLETEDSSHLELAKFWLESWAESYPSEYNSAWDRVEGTAEYVGQSYSGNLGRFCESLSQAIPSTPANFSILLDLEAYDLGLISGLALDQLGIKWKGLVAADSNLSALKILLNDFEAAHDSYEEYTKARTELKLGIYTELLDPVYGRSAEDFKNSRKTKLVIPSDWDNGVTSFIAFVLHSELTNMYLSAPMDIKRFINPIEKNEWFEINADTVLYNFIYINKIICGMNSGTIVLLEKHDLTAVLSSKISDKIELNIGASSANLDIAKEEVEGEQYYCLQ